MATIYKVKAVETIYNQMKQYMIGLGSAITNFNVGSRIRTLLEAIAITDHRTQYDFNVAIKQAIPLSVFNGFEFERKAGIAASGKLEFERATPAGSDFTIPIGTAVTLDNITYETIEAGEISTGNTSSGQLSAQCSVVGTQGNIAIDAIDTLSGKGAFVNQPTGIESVSNPTAFAGGQDQESDEDRLKRFRNFINSLARSTVLGIETGAKTVEGVIAATIVENDPSPGFLKLYVDDGTGTLTPALKTEVEKVINGDPNDSANYPGYRPAGVQVTVLAPTLVDITINIELRILNSSLADDGELINLAKTALENYINTLSLGYDVIYTEIAKVIKNASVDIYDANITAPSANVVIASTEIARIDAGNYTVTSTRIANP